MLITADAVVCMDPLRRVLAPGWVRVTGAEITAVGSGPPPLHSVEEPVRHAGVLLPGLVSAHQHTVDSLLRGAAVPGTFLGWLLDTQYAGVAALTPEQLGLATSVAVAASLSGGVTTLVDCWGIDHGTDAGRALAAAEASLEAHRRSGARVLFARMFAEHAPDAWHARPGFPIGRVLAPAAVALDQVVTLAARHHRSEQGRIRVGPSPELGELCTPGALRDALALAGELGVPLPLHLCASPESRAAFGPADLAAAGILGPRLLAAHCTAVDQHDVDELAGAGVAVAHCPTSNLALRGAVTPVAAFRRAGATVGLGLDNGSLNPRLDLLGEARAAVAASIGRRDPVTTDDVLAMATIDGARTVGLDHLVGSIEVGKRADLVLLDTGGDHWWPHDSVAEAVVGQSRVTDVRTVLVDGRAVVEDGRCRTLPIDRDDVLEAAATSRAVRGHG
ncbi:amidohydrolase family protein [Aquihabitans sp. G128]|uniref:amidohydrolase family protein n=1 Tax=Aquihabitans sp. G128 TaxID=2849779 RepID=UPI001C228573|nr:amidohydrolase family protein [Aquihabitans sp. G128]QXC60204.1 amidohydrolase family protein [Aquihabitans sp. G128]